MLAIMEVTINEAAAHLGISADTVRRRIRKHLVTARQVPRPQGHVWMVDLPISNAESQRPAPPPVQGDNTDDNALVVELKARIDSLETQLTTRAGEIDQLHRLLAQTALNASPAQPWWRFWKG